MSKPSASDLEASKLPRDGIDRPVVVGLPVGVNLNLAQDGLDHEHASATRPTTTESHLPSSPPPPPASPSPPQFIGFIDVESLDGRSILSEVCVVICRVVADPTQPQCLGSEQMSDDLVRARIWSVGPLRIVETYHRILLPPTWSGISTETSHQIEHVSHYVTGLHYATLEEEGIPFRAMLAELQRTLDLYPGIRLLARDPRLECQLLRRADIHEVCDFLHAPLNQLFLPRAHRPLRLKSECAQRFTCHHHHQLADQRASLHPHCAQADCMEMLAWLQMWGQVTADTQSRLHPHHVMETVNWIDQCFPALDTIAPPPSFATSSIADLESMMVQQQQQQQQQQQTSFDFHAEAWPQLGSSPPLPPVPMLGAMESYGSVSQYPAGVSSTSSPWAVASIPQQQQQQDQQQQYQQQRRYQLQQLQQQQLQPPHYPQHTSQRQLAPPQQQQHLAHHLHNQLQQHIHPTTIDETAHARPSTI